MPLKVSNIRLPVEEPEESLPRHVARRLGVTENDLRRWRILRKSLDARARNRLDFVYSVAVELSEEDGRLARFEGHGDVGHYVARHFDDPPAGNEPLFERPVIIGSGPAGLLAGYYLATRGYRPLIIERGQPVKQRVPAIREFDRGGEFDRENNYLFGEGGAGTFSDGKLTCRMSGPDVDWVLDRFVECGGKSSLRFDHRPHLGSNRLPLLVRNFRRKIEAAGGEYQFGCRFEGLDIVDGRVRRIMTSSGPVRATHVILAIGHSARDTYEMLYELGIGMYPKAFQMGLRIEQPQEQINSHKYGKPEYVEILGAADYALIASGQRDLFTFCMCAGGYIIPSVSGPEMFCTNGMSDSRHNSSFANSGLVTTVPTTEFGSSHPLAGVELQRRFESVAFELAGGNYFTPIQTAQDFLAGRTPEPKARLECSYQRGLAPMNLADVVPPCALQALREGMPIMDKKWRGGFLRNAVLVGPEMRGSSPLRIDRDRDTFESPTCAGLYPVGEGAGYAGGIVSAAVDGLRAAKKIAMRFAPLEKPDHDSDC
ncbi:MAG: FAD-dependent oxidoreductase [Proteobacteria bacterium]|nr:FAD-dependent oxidoreductase [Pseudomonadota bacterium]